MFDSISRYYNLKTKTLEITDQDNQKKQIRYIERRFLPSADEMTIITEHTITQDDRIDNISALYLGDPTLFWHICDANEVFRPVELTDEIGEKIKISLPNI